MGTRLARRPELPLFLLCLGFYAYFYQAGGWNQNSRFDLVRSIVEQGTSRIDSYHRNTGDLACRGPRGRCKKPDPGRGDHAYCDKAPGLSWLAVPAYAAIHAAAQGDEPGPRILAIGSYASTVFAVALPSALGVVALFALLGALGLSARACTLVSLAYGLGTLALPYATLFYGHQLMASLVLIAFALLVHSRHVHDRTASPARLGLAGALLGLAVAVEYPAALAAGPICVYAAVTLRPRMRLLWLVAGMAGPGLALAAYHWLVFGSPFALPYDFSTQPHRGQGFFMGLGAIDGHALSSILFSAYRGLFYTAPWLLVAVPGAVFLVRERRLWPEALVCMAVVLLFVWLNASLVDWQGGWAMGPRYLIPAIPFLAVLASGAVPLASRTSPLTGRLASRGASIVFALAALYSAFVMLAGAAVKPEVPVHIKRPVSGFVLPRLYSGELAVNTQSIDRIAPSPTGEPAAWNLGQILGLDGLASLVPLGLLVVAMGLWIRSTLRARPLLTGNTP